MLHRDSADVTSANLPTRNVNLTSLPIARIVLILKAELFLRTGDHVAPAVPAAADDPVVPAGDDAQGGRVAVRLGRNSVRASAFVRVANKPVDSF